MSEPQQPATPDPSTPYAAPGANPVPAVTPPPGPGPAPSKVATVALVLGLIALAISLMSSAIMQALIFSRSLPPSMYGAVSGMTALLVSLVAVAALVCGLLAFRNNQTGRARAGIAVGIAIVLLSSQVFLLALGAAAPLFSRF